MNMSLTPSRTNLLHLIAILLVCTMAFVTITAPLLANNKCDEWREKRDKAEAARDTYKDEAAEYKKKYDDTSWLNPIKKAYSGLTQNS